MLFVVWKRKSGGAWESDRTYKTLERAHSREAELKAEGWDTYIQTVEVDTD